MGFNDHRHSELSHRVPIQVHVSRMTEKKRRPLEFARMSRIDERLIDDCPCPQFLILGSTGSPERSAPRARPTRGRIISASLSARRSGALLRAPPGLAPLAPPGQFLREPLQPQLGRA